MRLPSHHRYTWAQYLVLERDSNVKHEFLDGEIYAMSGGSAAHSALIAATLVSLGQQLRGKPCRLYDSNLRVRVVATGLASYPDVTVVCGSKQFDPADTLINPTLLVEVLSPSTESYDRNAKFEHYQQIGSLREYVLVSQEERLIEVFRRTENDWGRFEARTGGGVALESVGCTLDVDALYEGIELKS